MKKLLLLFLIVLIPFFLTACTAKNPVSSSEAESVAIWLTQSGAKIYGAWWCPHCAEQKRIFGEEAYKKVNYIECANPDRSQNATCQAAKIESYPTWEFADGSRVNQVMSLEQLKAKTSYPKDGIAGPQPVTANP